MKKLTALLLALVLVLALPLLFGCNGDGGDEVDNSAAVEGELRAIYAAYLDITEELPLPYDAWLDAISGRETEDVAVPYVGTNGNWYFSSVDSGVKANPDAKVKVTFVKGNDTKDSSIKYDLFSTVSIPEDPTRGGYDFLGWFVGEEEWQFNSYCLVGNVTITAKWEHSKDSCTDDKCELHNPPVDIVFQLNARPGDLSGSGIREYYTGEVGDGEYVDEEVIERNRAAEKYANVRIVYEYVPETGTDYMLGNSVSHMQTDSWTTGGSRVDIFSNYAYDMMAASLHHGFADLNATVYGDGNNYFGFAADGYEKSVDDVYDLYGGDGYYYDYMRSLTLSRDKVFALASTYTMDVLRSMMVVPVNVGMLNGIDPSLLPEVSVYDEASGEYKKLSRADYESNIEYLYDVVWRGGWTYDTLATYCNAIYIDSNKANNGDTGTSTLGDKLGFALTGTSSSSAIGLLYSSSVKFADVNITDDYSFISYPNSNRQFEEWGAALAQMVSGGADHGIAIVDYSAAQGYGAKRDTDAIALAFKNDSLLFGGITTLGALDGEEYQSVREAGGIGFLPIPVYRAGESYNTPIFNTAKVVSIALKSRHFERCTKLLDYLSKSSDAVLDGYYERNLTATKSGGDVDNSKMLAYIRNSVRGNIDHTYEMIMQYESRKGDSYAAMRRWHEIIRLNGYCPRIDIEYDRVYGDKHSDLLGIYQDWSQLEERWYGGMEKWYDAPEN